MEGKKPDSAIAPTIGVAFTGDIVNIAIGPEGKLHKVHKDVVSHHSDYFRAAFNGKWQEAEEGVTLDDVEPQVFDIFVYWIYREHFPKIQELADIAGSNIEGHDRARECWTLLLKACIFGDRFLAPRFKQAANNVFVSIRIGPIIQKDIHEAFEILKEDDLLLKFIVEMQCRTWDADVDQPSEVPQRELLPPSFLVRVMIRYSELRTSASWIHINRCDYHYHESEEERRSCPDNKKTRVR